jgi:hypothetical protein
MKEIPSRWASRSRALVLVTLLTALWPSATLAAASDRVGTPGTSETPDRGTWSFSGSVALEQRWFLDPPAFPGQSDDDQPSALFSPELRWRSVNRRHQFDLALFSRLDGRDDERSHFDLRECSYRYIGDSFELLAGISRVFWGVTESRHLVDVINQTDAVEDIDDEDKLGQPMLQLAFERHWGRLELFSLLGFRERTFPGPDGRLRPPLPVDHQARQISGREVDWAARWSHVLGDWDLAAYIFLGTGREPQLRSSDDSRSLIPVYRRTQQVGVEAQYTRGAWLFKLEALAREGQGTTFGATVVGFERTFYQVGRSAADLGILVEVLWDGRDATAPATIYDQDTFVGARLALNDIQDTQFLAGAVIDHEDQSVAGFVEATRRFGRRFTVELEGRFFSHVDPTGDLATVDRDSFIALRTAWHW